jgi:hypothetical protein
MKADGFVVRQSHQALLREKNTTMRRTDAPKGLLKRSKRETDALLDALALSCMGR